MRRRTFLGLAGGGLAGAWAGCGGGPSAPSPGGPGHLSARPGPLTGAAFANGAHILDEVATPRPPVLWVPPDHDVSGPSSLVVLYHGAGASAENWRSPYDHAYRLGLLLLLMQSRGATWDLIQGGYGVDAAATDEALSIVFEGCAVDPARVSFAGFSDGASYALSLGLSNPALVRRVVAFSPGFHVPGSDDEPRAGVFISHGTRDLILPVQLTGRTIAERLTNRGYDVLYTEFDGGHEVPPEISRAAFDWLAEG